jgi:hypothetical protein
MDLSNFEIPLSRISAFNPSVEGIENSNPSSAVLQLKNLYTAGSSLEYVYAITTDNYNNVYITGSFMSAPADFDPAGPREITASSISGSLP